MIDSAPLLTVTDLSVRFDRDAAHAVADMSFDLAPGRTIALVGASGSGKTTACRALLGLLPATAHVAGSISLAGRELVGLSDTAMRGYRGSGMAMVLQNPDRSLNPTMRTGDQLVRALRIRRAMRRHDAVAHARELLRQTEFAEPDRVMRCYPHQLSGGMRQRVAIAIALSQQPRVLVADEPTTALDASTQATIMSLLMSVQRRSDLAIVLVSHDLALACTYADDIAVLHDGRLVETFAASTVHTAGRRPHTRDLIRAAQDITDPTHRDKTYRPPPQPPRPAPAPPRSISVLDIRDIVEEYAVDGSDTGSVVRAVAGVTLDIRRGETLALVGESGSGKSTLAQAILHAPAPTGGEVRVNAVTLSGLSAAERREQLRNLQIILQNPLATMDPTWRISTVVAEPLRTLGLANRAQQRTRVDSALALVGLEPALWRRRRRSELSGGQSQQVAIARALVVEPSLIVLDEAVSSLDGVTKSRILALLEKLQDQLNVAYLFIAHDLGVVRRVSDRVAVMYRGRICEVGPTYAVLDAPRHPYTVNLRADDPAINFRRNDTQPRHPVVAPASTPVTSGSGCAFHHRCAYATQLCREVEPPMRLLGPDHSAACHFPLNTPAAAVGVRAARPPRTSDRASA